MTPSPDTAVVAKRADRGPVDTTEIEGLVEAAGYTVAAVLTQVRPEDPGTHLGRGKVDELVEAVTANGAGTVVIDGELTAGQARNLILTLPEDRQLLDRYRLVLDLFAEGATDRRALAQVELARLEYELEWFEAVADESPLTRMNEKGSYRYQLEDRITDLTRELNAMPAPDELARQRRQEGFDLVTIAGYTNAGKSTLLRLLADDLEVEDGSHDDVSASAAVEDRLFKTLETTTRRATLRDRPVLCTDTVGYVSELPHELVVAFAETLSAAGAADAVVLVTEATDQPTAFETKLAVSREVLDAQGVDAERIVPVLNKVDAVAPDVVDDRLRTLAGFPTEPVAISARHGTNLDDLVDAVVERLPTASRTLRMPYADDAMALVSRAYDRATVTDVDYRDDTVSLTVEGRPTVVDELAREAASAADEAVH